MRISLLIYALMPALFSCASTTIYSPNKIQTFNSGSCAVQVFYSPKAAQQLGNFQEVCTVEGTSAMSFDHSLDGAIQKNTKALCSCGVDIAYLSASHRQTQMGVQGVTHVTLVGIKLD